ncbi:MAG TPA: FtsX-like permease family protein [Armatimonadetes bacterium]|nr:FtsX-like permease family protein [Armatimonadota bacterium]
MKPKLVLLSLLLFWGVSAGEAAELSTLYGAVDMENIRRDVETLAALGSRVTGYPGAGAAAELIRDRFRQLGLQDLTVQEFDLPVPVDKGALLRVGGETFRLYALWPNLIRPSSLPPGGVRGRLIYAQDGAVERFNGLEVENSIVLLDFNCGLNWLHAPLLGARAVIFIAPEDTDRGEAEEKFLRVPLNVPRFWIERETGQQLAARAQSTTLSAHLEARTVWENRPARNILGFIPGTDPNLSRECIILGAYYDSISIVPALAPGAEQACGIATLLELARLLVEHPPRRTVAVVAISGHFEALAGARLLANTVRREFTRERERKARALQLRADRRLLNRLKKEREELAFGAETDLSAEQAEEKRQLRGRELQRRIALLEAQIALTERFYEYELPLFIGLDLSSQNHQIGAFHVGWYYRADNLTRFFSPLGKRLKQYAADVLATVPAAGDDTFVDAINPTQDRNWETYIPGQLAADAEMFVEAGRAGMTFFTVIDSRPYVDTPLDTGDKVNFANLEKQVRMLACLVPALINDPELKSTALKRIKRLPFDLKVVNGSVYEFEREKTFLPNTPVPGALVLVKGQYKSMLGVRSDVITMADSVGEFTMQGYQDYGGAVVDAYALDPYSGDIIYAPDLGPEGETKYPRDVRGRLGLKRPVIVFPCRALDLYDLVDERYFETLEQIFIYNAQTDSEPRSYGYVLPIFSPMGGSTIGGSISPSYVEPVAVIFAEPGIRVKITMSMGLLGRRLVLLNATREEPEGRGFDPHKMVGIPATSYRAARDMWILDDARIKRYAEHGISNRRLNHLHALAEQTLKEAEEARQQRDYARFLAAARTAWAYEARAYPDVMRTATDVVKGVLFYLALLLPFAYFMERLLIASPNINKQVAWTFGIFLLVYAALRYVHPAFELVNTSLIILLGFVILALAVVVISIVTSKFNEQLERFKEEMMGTHAADVSRLSTLGAAFHLGISNMRRRKARTALTCATLILLTFTVLSFTSVQTFLRSNKILQKHPPTYPGIMVRDRVWGPLEEPTAGILANQFGRSEEVARTEGKKPVYVAPRAWFTSANLEKRLFIDVITVGEFPRTYTINAILGLSPQEKHVTNIQQILLAGEWFTQDNQAACILPEPVARSLGIRPGDVGQAQVSIFGTKFTVVGIIEAKKLQNTLDLDGETITPVDYSLLKPEILRQLQELQQSKLKLGSTSQTALLEEYQHFLPSEIIILPYERLINMGGTLRSVAMCFGDPEEVKAATETLLNRFELSAYASEGDKTYLYSSVGMTTFTGLSNVFIPILIAALIVLNTMLGAVYERLREIGIFSSIGLAPVHISTLFLAESCVFANIGVIVGYLLGQTVSKIVMTLVEAGYLQSLTGLSLNYSSLAAVGVAVIIMATVLLSTLYPARKAGQMAVPDVERKWKLPEPEGDEMVIRLPFMLTGGDAKACNMFLKEFFDAYVDYAGGDFYTDKVEFTRLDTEYGEGYRLYLRVWLAPYDLGVSQYLDLRTTPTEEGHIYQVDIILHRVSGDINSWKKTNWLFLNILRKQFLIWRTIPIPEKREYEAEGEEWLKAA